MPFAGRLARCVSLEEIRSTAGCAGSLASAPRSAVPPSPRRDAAAGSNAQRMDSARPVGSDSMTCDHALASWPCISQSAYEARAFRAKRNVFCFFKRKNFISEES